MIIYDIIYILFSFFYVPFSIFKKGWRGFNLRQRCGTGINIGARHAWPLQDAIWLHAVSVGEVVTLIPLVDKIKGQIGSHPIVISVTTKAGYDVARRNFNHAATVIYSPLDLTFIVNRFFKLIRPKILIIMETEIWPNMLHIAKSNNVPAIIINGRISLRSFGRYKIAKPFLRPTLEKIDLFCMQSEADASRIISIGAPVERVKVTGNMKFDVLGVRVEGLGSRETLKLNKKDILIVAGSTHRGEEKILLDAYKGLRRDFGNLKLLIAPRHINRIPQLELLVRKVGFVPVRVSSMGTYNSQGTGLTEPISFHETCPHHSTNMGTVPLNECQLLGSGTVPIFVLDVIGQLKDLYSIADIVFIGGSLAPHGGQNPIEPAYFSRPIIFGPYMFNFDEISHLLLKATAAIEVKDISGLKEAIASLINNPQKARNMGDSAKEAIEQ